MAKIGSNKNEEKEDNVAPRLNALQLADITRQYLELGKTSNKLNKLLFRWKAIELDERGGIRHICDYTEWYSRNEVNKAKYDNYEPIKGVRYLGQGGYTFMPYTWCQEWLATWGLWVTERAKEGNADAKKIAGNVNAATLKELREKVYANS